MTSTITLLPTQRLHVSSTGAQAERRKRLDKAALAELAASIKTVGLLQPLVVRNHPGKAGEFEIVAGERRFLAVQQAGLTDVQCNVRELTDEQVLEVQLVENLQREGLHELVEAEGYEALMKLGHSAESIAAKVGKSKAYVYARLKLTALCPEGRKAFHAGKLSSSVALLVARVPESLQAKALKEVLEDGYGEEGMMSARDAADHIRDTYMLRLADAGFPTGDATLVPAAGACGACPKRTGNQPQLFADVKGADVCTDPICFKAKREANARRLVAEAEARGQTVISGKAAKTIARHGTSNLSGYARLDEQCWDDPKHRTYRQLLGKGYVPQLLQTDDGEVIEVAPIADVKKSVPAVAKASTGSSSDWKAAQRREEKKRALELAYRAEILSQIQAAGFKDDAEKDLSLACLAMADRMHHDGIKRLFAVMGWPVTEKKDKYRGMVKEYNLAGVIAKAKDESSLWRLLRLFSVAGDLEVYSNSGKPTRDDRLHTLAARVGVKASKIHDALVAAEQAKAKPKAAKKK